MDIPIHILQVTKLSTSTQYLQRITHTSTRMVHGIHHTQTIYIPIIPTLELTTITTMLDIPTQAIITISTITITPTHVLGRTDIRSVTKELLLAIS